MRDRKDAYDHGTFEREGPDNPADQGKNHKAIIWPDDEGIWSVPNDEDIWATSADREHVRHVTGLSLLAFLVFLGVTFYGNSLVSGSPDTTLTMAIVLLTAGLPGLTYGVYALRQYKNVLDYEPVQFWGRRSNGGTARGILQTIAMLGLGSSLSGIALAVIMWLHLTQRL